MQKLARKELVNHMDYNTSRDVGFCEACVGGKQHKNSFKLSSTETSMPLDRAGAFRYVRKDREEVAWGS